MSSKIFCAVFFACVAFTLTGCTLLPVKNLQPLIAPPEGLVCPDPVHLMTVNKDAKFAYMLPDDSNTLSTRSVTMDRTTPLYTFDAYHKAVGGRVNNELGSDLANDPVVKAFSDAVAAVSAEAQLDAAIADGTASSADIKTAAIPEHTRTRLNSSTLSSKLSRISCSNSHLNLPPLISSAKVLT